MASNHAINDAIRYYKKHTALHGASTMHKNDLAAIKAASVPSMRATTLVAQRNNESVDDRILEHLNRTFGRKKRHTYNQEAVICIEHMFDGPIDPITQAPLWHSSIAKTAEGGTLSRTEFYATARAILSQHQLYEAETMRG